MRPRKIVLKPFRTPRDRDNLIVFLAETYNPSRIRSTKVAFATEWEFNYDA